MKFCKPIHALWQRWRRSDDRAANRRQAASAAKRRERLAEVELFPRLYDTQLEDRQLLDASPLVQLNSNGVLAVNAGAQASDGVADHFEVREITTEQGSQFAVSVNGQEAGLFAKGDVKQIQVQGSSDADTLLLDASSAPPDGVVFDGGGTAADPSDTLILQWTGGAGPQSVQHVLATTQGAVTATWQDAAGTIDHLSFVAYVGVEQVNDQWQAESRSIELAEGVSGRVTGEVESGVSRLDSSAGVRLDFADASRSLTIEALGVGDPTASADAARLQVAGNFSLRGGTVRFDAGQGGLLDLTANVSTASDSADGANGGVGGDIDLLGDRVYVRSGSTIDASGATRGGLIRIGGDYQGSNPDVRNAMQAVVEDGALVRTDGLGAGDGGRLIVWSDDLTVVWGNLSVRGGETGGDGGFVETSGRRVLDVQNAPDLRAPNGRGGSWLIDPNNITISNSATSNISVTGLSYKSTNDGANLKTSELVSALKNGNVTISTSTAGANTEPGNITLSDNLDFDGINTGTLTLNAHNDIILNGSISDSKVASNDQLNIVCNADSDNSGGGKIRLNNATLDSRGGSLTFQDAVVLGANVTINSVGNTTSGSIAFNSSISADDAAANNRTLTITAGTSKVTFGGDIGTAGALADLDVTAATISLGGDVTVNDGSGTKISFTGATSLAANVTINTDTTGLTDNDLEFIGTGTINADDAITKDRTLTVLAGNGAVTFGGTIGKSQALADLDVTAKSISLGGDVIVNDASNSTVTFSGAVSLAANVTINTDTTAKVDNNLTFSNGSTIDADNATTNNRTLTILAGAGAVSFGGNIGGTQALANLDVTANSISLGGNVTANDGGGSTIKFTGAVALAANVTINTDTSVGADNSVLFSGPGTIDADDVTKNDRTLTIQAASGSVTFGGAIGSTGALADLDVTASSISLGGDVTVNDGAGGQTVTFAGATLLQSDVRITTDGTNDNKLSFTGTPDSINSGSSTPSRLILQAGAGDVRVSGAVGSSKALRSFEIVSAGDVELNSVAANGDGSDASIINLGSTGISGSVTLHGDLTATGGATQSAIAFNLNGVGKILLDKTGGPGTIGFQTSGSTATNGVTFASPTTISSATAFDDGATFTLGAGALDLSSVSFNQLDHLNISATGSQTIKLDSLTLGDGKGNSASVGTSLSVVAAVVHLNGDVSTNGEADGGRASFVGAVELGQNITVNTEGTASSGDVEFSGPGTIDADSTVGSRTLTVNAGTGAVVFGGTIGATRSLADLDVTAKSISLGGNVTVNSGLAVDAKVTFNGATTLTNSITIDTDVASGFDNSVTFGGAGTIDADLAANKRTLVIKSGSGTVTFGGAIGATQSLADLDVTAKSISLGGNVNVNADSGATVTFTGATTLAADLTINTDASGTTDNNLTFSGPGTIDADLVTNNRKLTVLAGNGTVSLNGAVGAAQALADLDVTAKAINLGGNLNLFAKGGLTSTFTGATTLKSDVIIQTTDGTVSNNLTFSGTTSTINSDSTPRGLDIKAGTGNVTLEGDVGGTNKVSRLRVLAANIDVNDVFTTRASIPATIALTATNQLTLRGDLDTTASANAGAVQLDAGVGIVLNAAGNSAGSVHIRTNGTTSDGAVSINAKTGISSAQDFQDGLTLDVGDQSLDLQMLAFNKLDHLTVLTGASQTVDLGTLVLGDGAGADNTHSGALNVVTGVSRLHGSIATNGESNGGAVELESDVLLSADVTINTDSTTKDGAVTVAGTISSDATPRSLVMTAGGGAVSLNSGAGTTTAALADLDVTGATIALGGDLVVNAAVGKDVTLTGAITISKDLKIDATGNNFRTVGSTSSIDEGIGATGSRLTITTGTGNILLEGAVGQSSALDAFAIDTANDVTLTGVSTSGAAVANTINLGTNQIQGKLTLRGDLRTDAAGPAGGIRINSTGAVLLDKPGGAGTILLDTDATTGADGAVTFVGGFNVSSLTPFEDGLTIQVGENDADLSGATLSKLDHLIVGTASDRTVTLGTTSLGRGAGSGGQGALLVNTGTANLLGGIDTTSDPSGDGGKVTFNANVVLKANVNIKTNGTSATDGDVLLNGTVNSDDATLTPRTLAIDAGLATATLRGDVGTAPNGALADLDITAATIQLAASKLNIDAASATSQAITFNGNVQLQNNVSIDVGPSLGAAKNLTFGGRVNADDSSANDRTLSVDAGNGIVTFSGDVGTATNGALADLDVTAATIALQGSTMRIDDSKGGVSSFAGVVTLGNNVTFDTVNGANSNGLTFTGRVQADSAVANDRKLTVTAGASTVTFGDDIGAVGSELAGLDITAGTIALQGSQVLVSDGAASTAKFSGTVELRNSVTVDAGASGNSIQFNGPIVADNVSGDRRLNVMTKSGVATFSGDIGVGANRALADFDVTAATIVLDGITANINDATTGQTVQFNGATQINKSVTINTDGAGTDNDVQFLGTVDSADATNTDAQLTILAGDASVDFSSNIGAGTKGELAALNVTGKSMSFAGGSVLLNDTSVGGITSTLTGTIALKNNVTFSTDGAGSDNNLTFQGPVTTDDSTLQDRTLTVLGGGGTIALLNGVGDQVNGRLADLDVTAAKIQLAGDFVVDDSNGQSIVFTGATTLMGNVTFDVDTAAGIDNSLQFSGAIDGDTVAGARQLSITAGNGSVGLDGAAGATVALGALAIRSAGDVTLSSVNTAGAATTYTIDLGVDAPLAALKLTGNLSTNAGTGDAGGVRMNVAGPITLRAGAAGVASTIQIVTDGPGADGALVISNGATITSETAYEDGLTLLLGSQSVDLSTTNFNSVDHLKVVTASGQSVSLGNLSLGDGAGTGTRSRTSLDVTTGTTTLFGNVLANQDTSGFAGAVNLRSDVVLATDATVSTDIGASTTNDANILITGKIDADNALNGDRHLTMNAGSGQIFLQGEIGTSQALADLDLTASVIELSGPTINLFDGPGGEVSTLNGDVSLANNVTITSGIATGPSNSLLFQNAIRADAAANNRTLTIHGGNGTVSFRDTVGTGGALADFDVDAATIELSDNLQIDQGKGGAIVTLKGQVKLLGNVTVDTDGTNDNSFQLLGASSRLDADSVTNNRNFTVTAGSGDVSLDGAVGQSQRLSNFAITGARNVTAASDIFAGRFSQGAGTGTSTFIGRIDTNASAGTSITTGGSIAIGGGITTTGNGGVTLTQRTGLSISGDIASDGAIIETGGGGVTIAADRNVSSTGDLIQFADRISLGGTTSGEVLLASTAAGNTGGADITLSQGFDATNGQRLRIDAGNLGDVVIGGNVGSTNAVGGLSITNAHDFTLRGSFVGGFLSQVAGTGATTITQSITTTDVLGVNLATQGTISLKDVTTKNGGTVTFQNGDTLTLNGNVASDGSFQQTGKGNVVVLAGNRLTTTSDAASFVGDIKVESTSLRGGEFLIDTSTGGGAAVSFTGKIDSAVSNTNALRIAAGGSGDVMLDAPVGSIAPLKALIIQSARDVQTGAINVGSLAILGATGSVTLNDNVVTTDSGGVTIQAGGAITVMDGKSVEAKNLLTMKSGGDINLLSNSQLVVQEYGASSLLSLTAGNLLNFGTGAVVRVKGAEATGTQPNVDLTKTETAPGVNIGRDGKTTINALFADPSVPGASNNYSVTIDWRDTTIDRVGDGSFAPNTQHPFSHTYIGNPGPDPTSPITIFVSVAFDSHIQLSQQGGATPLGRVTVPLVLFPPTSGLFGFNVIAPNNSGLISRPEIRPMIVSVIPVEPTPPLLQRFEPGSAASVANTVGTRQIVLTVVLFDADGQPLDSEKSIVLSDDVLDDLPKLFQSLPDDRYRIYMKMENGSKRLIKDFVIRNRKAVELEDPRDQFDEEKSVEPIEPAEKEPMMNAPRPATRVQAQPNAPAREEAAQGIAAGGALAVAAEALARRRGGSWKERVRRTLRNLAGAAQSQIRPRLRRSSDEKIEETEFPS